MKCSNICVNSWFRTTWHWRSPRCQPNCCPFSIVFNHQCSSALSASFILSYAKLIYVVLRIFFQTRSYLRCKRQYHHLQHISSTVRKTVFDQDCWKDFRRLSCFEVQRKQNSNLCSYHFRFLQNQKSNHIDTLALF